MLGERGAGICVDEELRRMWQNCGEQGKKSTRKVEG